MYCWKIETRRSWTCWMELINKKYYTSFLCNKPNWICFIHRHKLRSFTKEDATEINCLTSVYEDTDQLRNSLWCKEGTEIISLVVTTADEMIQSSMMLLDWKFNGVTVWTNWHKVILCNHCKNILIEEYWQQLFQLFHKGSPGYSVFAGTLLVFYWEVTISFFNWILVIKTSQNLVYLTNAKNQLNVTKMYFSYSVEAIQRGDTHFLSGKKLTWVDERNIG